MKSEPLFIRHGTLGGRDTPDVLRALESCWVATMAILLTHAPLELGDRIVAVFFHPFSHFALNHPDLASSMRFTPSRLSLKGEAEGTSGVRNFIPR